MPASCERSLSVDSSVHNSNVCDFDFIATIVLKALKEFYRENRVTSYPHSLVLVKISQRIISNHGL